MSGERRYNAPYLCTGRSARSILAEFILSRFASLPIARLDRPALQKWLDAMGWDAAATASTGSAA